MFNKINFSFLILFGFPIWVMAQTCSLSISGHIFDANTNTPISYANIVLEENQLTVASDINGFFEINGICEGEYHLNISHIGCQSIRNFMTIDKNQLSLIFKLDHHEHTFENVVVSANKTQVSAQESKSVNEKTISENANQNLSNLLENINGVSTLKNGNGISKPIIHGLYGNRLTILNNGVAQSGQQWGNDHSPEIDPLAANQLEVIKGVGALEYQGNSLGSVILVKPRRIRKDPHLHGKGSYFFETNGLGHGLNLQLQEHTEKIDWSVTGTLKKSGDKNTPNYFLTNTGNQEANIALQLQKVIKDDWYSDLYLSSFNSSLGVLRGSHIGNLTDLEMALTREVPFFTADTFSYQINAPRQEVNHHLLKLHTKKTFHNNATLELTAASQWNIRKEFDIRRGNRTDIPALNLSQFSHFAEAKYKTYLRENTLLKTGIQFNSIFNKNNPETGIFPLIPDYNAYKTGVFAILTKQFSKAFLEFGARYDYNNQRVATFSRGVPVEILRYNNGLHNFSASSGVDYRILDHLKLSYNLGFATRNPAVNELYSNGLHQGVSGIEEGDPNLGIEKSLKTTLGIEGRLDETLFFEALFYYQNINDYIYLQPQDKFRLTIRGAFPVFKYEQTNAQIYGSDWSVIYNISEHFSANIKYSYLKGWDLENDLPLIFMPANNLLAVLKYQIPHLGKFENIEFEINNQYVFEQKNLTKEQDFATPPPAYNLIGLKVATQRQLKKNRLNLFVKVDNLLNVEYRDYLNRQRYFADDLGISAVLGFNITF
jgi:iron complex outermembrane receptor protein